jgi:hypothetical protein
MKKGFVVVCLISLATVLVLNCQKESNPVEIQLSGQNNLASLSKGGSPRPETPLVKDFSLYDVNQGQWISIITDNVKKDVSSLSPFDFTTTNGKIYQIRYHITNSTGITAVRIGVWCDMITNGYKWPMDGLLENGGDMFTKAYNGLADTDVQSEFMWDGTITTEGWDEDVYGKGTQYKLFDYLAPFNHAGFTNLPTDIEDPYGIYIYVDSPDGVNYGIGFQITPILVKANPIQNLNNIYHVDDVYISKVGKTTEAVIKISDESNVPGNVVHVYGYFHDIANSQYYYHGVTDGQGIARIKAPTNKPGMSFWVKSVEKANGVYNPWNTHQSDKWPWPTVEPNGGIR